MNKPATIINGDDTQAFKVRLLAIGDDDYLLFVKDVSSKSDYIRLSFGYADSINQKQRSMHLFNNTICEPKLNNGTYLGKFNKNNFKNKKLWIVFQTVQRQKGKRGLALERFAGVSPPQSKWTKSIGSYTNFELKKINQSEYDNLQKVHELKR